MEEVVDLLLSFSDFLSFKQLMLDHKAVSLSLSLWLAWLMLCRHRGRRGRLWILED